jgi:hypothetical protein
VAGRVVRSGVAEALGTDPERRGGMGQNVNPTGQLPG